MGQGRGAAFASLFLASDLTKKKLLIDVSLSSNPAHCKLYPKPYVILFPNIKKRPPPDICVVYGKILGKLNAVGIGGFLIIRGRGLRDLL